MIDQTPGQEITYGSILLRTIGTIAKTRPAAYASEVGEAFRPVVPNVLVKSAYGLSLIYVASDIYIRTTHSTNTNKSIIVADALTYHTFASMLIPAITIHSIVKYTNKLTTNVKSIPIKKFGPSALGLLSIPFIIHPIDDLTDLVMNKTIRRLYN
jgi:mitochondrial fission process protein 1